MITDIQSAWRADDNEIIDYLKHYWGVDSFVCEGVFSNLVLEKAFSSEYSGSITNITIHGKSLSLPFKCKAPSHFNVRKGVGITPGIVRFEVKLAPREIRDRFGNPFMLTLNFRSLRNYEIEQSRYPRSRTQVLRAKETRKADEWQKKIIDFLIDKEHWGLEKPVAVGFYEIQPNGEFKISDFRSESFRELEYPANENEAASVSHEVIITSVYNGLKVSNCLKDKKYYKFSWTVERCDDYPWGFRIVVDNPLLENIKPNELIGILYDIWGNHPDARVQMGKAMDMVSTELMASSRGTFIYELLQNANDNPIVEGTKCTPVDVEFHLMDKYLICRHSGDYFSPRDIAAVCKTADESKAWKKSTIGYKGIGFKTVFHSHDWVYIESNDYSFSFQERKNRPWQIMPIWEDRTKLDPEILAALKNKRTKFRVVTVMRPREQKLLRETEGTNYRYLLTDIFKDVKDIIFIPNINSVKVFDNGECIASCQYDNNGLWIKSDLPAFDLSVKKPGSEISFEEEINREIALYPRRGIPKKYINYGDTKVSFACKINGRSLEKVEDATVNCYLPTKAMFGFPFLMNTDMIPTGDRNQLKLDVEFNRTFAYIAGIKFFGWIQQLLQEGNYDYDSIFSLVPDFNDCIQKHEYYREFILEFKKGFEEALTNKPIIPYDFSSPDGNRQIGFLPLEKVIRDTSGISCSGIIDDAIILACLGETNDKSFPAHTLRDQASCTYKTGISAFLKTYCKTTVFNTDQLVSVCQNTAISNWLADINHNTSFISFLLKKKTLPKFIQKPIFIKEGGSTVSLASSMYYDIEKYLPMISAFDPHLPRLCKTTREAFADDEQWKSFLNTPNLFLKFSPVTFVKSIVLEEIKQTEHSLFGKKEITKYECRETAKTLLKDKTASNGLFKFIEKNVSFFEGIKSIPIIDWKGNQISFKDYALLWSHNEDGIAFVEANHWIQPQWASFISDAYEEEVVSFLGNNSLISIFDEKALLIPFILNSSCTEEINSSIKNWDNNKSFVQYLIRHHDSLKDKVLPGFYLLAIDNQGNEAYCIPGSESVFFESPELESYKDLTWVPDGCIFSLSPKYSDCIPENEGMMELFGSLFKVKHISQESFIDDVVAGHKAEVQGVIKKDPSLSVSFWSWAKKLEEPEAVVDVFATYPVLAYKADEPDSVKSVTLSENLVYFSDLYLPPAGKMESVIRCYAPDSLFLSKEYLSSSGEISDTSKWYDFFKTIGVKASIEDLVMNSILPSLGSDQVQNENLPVLLGSYFDQISDRWASVKDWLLNLQVKTKDGGSACIQDCIIINANSTSEPFSAIQLKNEVHESIINNPSCKKLILKIAEYSQQQAGSKSKTIASLFDWRQEKITRYSGHESDFEDNVSYLFIKELSQIDDASLQKFSGLDSLRLLDKNGHWAAPTTLFLGHVYHPACDFETYGATTGIMFLSDKYQEQTSDDSIEKMLKKTLKVKQHFTAGCTALFKDNYAFTLYYWKAYVPKHLSSTKELFDSKAFSSIACVPTVAKTVAKAEDVYERTRQMDEFVVDKFIGWEKKHPSFEIPEYEKKEDDIFSKLPFKKELSFADGINALSRIRDKDKRRQILVWMKKGFNQSLHKDQIDNYRKLEDSLWRNGRGEYKHIGQLYCLDPDNTTLWEYFRDNEFIISSDYFPSDGNEYNAVRQMMQIELITSKDMVFDPKGGTLVTDDILKYMLLRFLILSGKESPDSWKERFDKYNNELVKLKFWKCEAITWYYNKKDSIRQSGKKFFNENGSDRIYYVGEWHGRQVFNLFIDSLYNKLGCKLNKDLYSDLLNPDNDVVSFLDYSMRKNESFILEMYRLAPSLSETVKIVVEESEKDDDSKVDEYRSSTTLINESAVADDGIGKDEVKEENIPASRTPDTSSERPSEEKAVQESIANFKENNPAKQQGTNETEISSARDSSQASSVPVEDKSPVVKSCKIKRKPDSWDEICAVKYYPKRVSGSSLQPPKWDKTTEQATLSIADMLDEELEAIRHIIDNNLSEEAVVSEHYLVRYRLYNDLVSRGYEIGELRDFILSNSKSILTKNKGYVYARGARGGILYVSTYLWGKLKSGEGRLCMYYGDTADDFQIVESIKQLIDFVGNDNIIIQIKGENKLETVESVFNGKLEGNAHILIRVRSNERYNSIFTYNNDLDDMSF